MPSQAAPTAVDRAVPDSRVPRDLGAMRITFSSDGVGALGEFFATLLLTDPRGRRTGVDASVGEMLQEIPRAWYDDEVIEDPETEGAGMASRIIEITAPEPGTYLLTVAATARGTYELSVRGYDARWEASGREFTDVAIGPSETHVYAIVFDPASAVAIEARRQ